MKVRFEATSEETGARIDVVLARRAGITRTQAQRALARGTITVDGRPVRAAHRVEPGETVAGEIPPPALAAPAPEDIPLVLRYEDERVLVVSKPAGLVTHPAGGHESGTLVNALLALGVPLAGRGSIRPGIVHRLDKDTSGLLLVAKDDAMHAHLVAALRARRVQRRYVALVRGRMPSPSGTIDAPVGRHPERRRQMAVVPDGRPAVTHYREIGRTAEVCLLDVALDTGRTHQIRVHLAHLGRPVVGDRAYGGAGEVAARLGLRRPFLHAAVIGFPHPERGEVTVTDPLPDDLAAGLAAAGLHMPG